MGMVVVVGGGGPTHNNSSSCCNNDDAMEMAQRVAYRPMMQVGRVP